MSKLTRKLARGQAKRRKVPTPLPMLDHIPATKIPSDLPDDLPPDTTLLALEDSAVLERVCTAAQLLMHTCDMLRDFIANGFPIEKDEEVRGLMTTATSFYVSGARGLMEWRLARDGDVVQAIAEGALRGTPEEIPPLVLAAYWCDIAGEAERDFWDILREHGPALSKAERGFNVIRAMH